MSLCSEEGTTAYFECEMQYLKSSNSPASWKYQFSSFLPAQFCFFFVLFFPQPAFKGTTLTDLPLCLQLNIMQRLSDGRDLVSLGQVAPDLQVLSEDRLLWKKLCQYHFTDRQVRGEVQIAISCLL